MVFHHCSGTTTVALLCDIASLFDHERLQAVNMTEKGVILHTICRKHIHHLPSCGRDSEFLVYDEDDVAKLMKQAVPRHWPNDSTAKNEMDPLLNAVSALKNCCESVHG